ncbi:MAG: AMP-binding protein, partial [Haloferacaceae archaeon]
MHRREVEASFEHPVRSDETLSQAFEASARNHVDRPAQQYKGGVYDRSLVAAGAVPAAPEGEFARLTYGEMRGLVRRLAAGFRSLGVADDERVGVVAHTRMEWALSDFALLAAGAVVTGVSPTASTGQIGSLLEDAGATGVVVENAAVLERVADVAADLGLSFAVVMDEAESVQTCGDGATAGGGGATTEGDGA